jgi:Protein of unknown function (DUF3551)
MMIVVGVTANGKEVIMRIAFLVAATAAAMLFDLRPVQAYYGNGPWCAVQNLGFGTVTQNCSMLTFEQCRLETIAGNRGFCIPNPYWAGVYRFAEPARRTHKRRIRHR